MSTSSLLVHIGGLLQQRQAKLPADHRFNVFSLLRPAHDEVQLHSRFLFELLKPTGSHGLGTMFLRLFMEHCLHSLDNQPIHLDYDKVRVSRETYGIDLFINDGTYGIVIENKIYALDQLRQLERYHDQVMNKNLRPVLCYLTLHGTVPSSHSLGRLALGSTQLLAYDDAIDKWLTSCIRQEQVTALPTLRETLIQYQKLTRQLTGNTMSDLKTPMIELLAQDDHAQAALAIVQTWHDVRHHTEFQFWTELHRLASADNWTVLPDGQFNKDKIDKALRSKRKPATGYGLNFLVHTPAGIPLRFKINRGGGLLSYGLVRPKPETLPEYARSILPTQLDVHFKSGPASFFLLSDNNRRGIDFAHFTTDTMAELVNASKRNTVAQQLWHDIAAFIQNVEQELGKAEALA